MKFYDYEGKEELSLIICRNILNHRLYKKIIIALRGTLGSGKTSFSQILIKAMCEPVKQIISPTFPIVQAYEILECFLEQKGLYLYHFDLYRIKSPKEVWSVGLDDAIEEGVCLVEWPEKLPPLADCVDFIDIHFSMENDQYVASIDSINESHELIFKKDLQEKSILNHINELKLNCF